MWRNPLFIIGVGVVVVAFAIVVNLSSPDDGRDAPPPAASQPSAAKAPTDGKADISKTPERTAKPGDPILPTFDVVRVSPTGDTVLAGRAAPGATVIIKDGQTEIGRIQADEKGEWVYIPGDPRPPGNRYLSLETTGPDGEILTSSDVVVLAVPERTDTGCNGAHRIAREVHIELQRVSREIPGFGGTPFAPGARPSRPERG